MDPMGKGWSSFFQVSVFRMLSSEAATLETFTYKKLSYQSHSPNLKPPISWNQNGQQQKNPTSPYSWNKKWPTTTKIRKPPFHLSKNPPHFFLVSLSQPLVLGHLPCISNLHPEGPIRFPQEDEGWTGIILAGKKKQPQDPGTTKS